MSTYMLKCATVCTTLLWYHSPPVPLSSGALQYHSSPLPLSSGTALLWYHSPPLLWYHSPPVLLLSGTTLLWYHPPPVPLSSGTPLLRYCSGTALVLPLTWSVHAVKCGHQTIVLQTLLITLLQ